MELYQVERQKSNGEWEKGVIWKMEDFHFRNFLTMFFENMPEETRNITRIKPIFGWYQANLTFDGKDCVEISQAERFIRMKRNA